MITNESLKRQLIAHLERVIAIGEAIRGLKQVPSGHLYAHVCHALPLDEYNQCIAELVKSGMVVQHPSYLLEWVGPTKMQARPDLN